MFFSEFKKDLTVLTSLIVSRKTEDEIKKAYIEISKKYHPDMNGKSEEEKAFYTECMRIINQVYERFEKGDIPEPVVQNSRKGPFKYTTYFGEEKSFDDYNEFLFIYGKDCYYAAKSFYNIDGKMKDAMAYFDDCIKAFEKWSINESKCVIIIKLDGDYIDVYLNDLNNHKENLKLRSAEATSSNVLTIMSAGTKVKILELGKTEIIYGINSNWVKIEIISCKDRNGNTLRSRTTGWCYGGYLK